MYKPLIEIGNQHCSQYDVIIIGTGIAGLYTALTLESSLNIMLVTKDVLYESNSNYAQGGIAAALDESDFENHVKDTLDAGSHYNDPAAVDVLVKEARVNILNLVKFGVNFDKNEDGSFLKTKEGGHSSSRILHYKDSTGREIIRALTEEVKTKENIDIYENTFGIDLIKEDSEIKGAIFEKNRELFCVKAQSVVIATGGIGRLYKNSTNSLIATGDGIAMAIRSGAKISDMEFVQFHPTALNYSEDRNFLISEALRGEGAILLNKDGERFMSKYHDLKELAPRDIVSQSIFKEMNKTNTEGVYLDISHKDSEYVRKRFPEIYSHCLEIGIDITKEYIPVVPVQHYLMGGIEVDLKGRTNLENLYACGEVSRTGIHGANRLASNSLLEGIVLGNRISQDINNKTVKKIEYIQAAEKNQATINSKRDYLKDLLEIRDLMSENVFIIRYESKLRSSLEILKRKYEELITVNDFSIEYLELMNMLITAIVIVKACLNRKESLGSHKIIID